MQPPAPRHRRARSIALATLPTLAALAIGTAPEAQAAPPTAQDFQVTYYITDELGDRGRQMSWQDIQYFVNQARCLCEQKIVARITLQGGGVDQEQITAMTGQNCAMAQTLPGVGAYAPCVILTTAVPQSFQNGPQYAFEPIWLAYGSASSQAIESAEPDGTCTDQQTSGGIWMCAGATNCQMGEFFMDGTSNNNVPMTESPQGINVDFIPPLTVPTDFKAEPGDSAVLLSWNVSATSDIAGYRMLCADEAGNPVDTDYEFTPPLPDSTVNSTIYYTRDNLCPGGVFGPDYDGMGGDGDGDTTGDGDGDTTGDGDGDTTGDGDGDTTGDGDGDTGTETGTTDCVEGTEGCVCGPEDVCDQGLACVDGVCESISCSPGELGCVCTAEGTCDAPYECDGGLCLQPTSGIASLDWSYVCSNHLGATTSSVRIGGLDNGTNYQFLLVAYDHAGNPLAADTVVMASPIPTNGLWEECETQGGICGQGWSCSVVDEPARAALWLGLLGFGVLGLGGLALRARRRRRA